MAEAKVVIKPAYELNPYDAPIEKTYPKHATVSGLMKASQDYRNSKNIKTAAGGTVSVFGVEAVPLMGMKVLQFVAESMGSEKTSKRHVQVVRFMDCAFSEEPQKGFLPGVYNKTASKFYFKPIQAKVNRVDVYCDCGDFQWRMAPYIDERFHALAAQLASEIKNYKRKTPPPTATGGIPYANPQHLPSMCKHLLTLFDLLYSKGVIV